MKSRFSVLALGLFLISAGAANAASTVSIQSGKTLGSGTAFHGELGWPGMSATLLGSMGPKLDLGGKFSFLWGYEGIPNLDPNPFGTKLQGVLRLGLLERGRFNMGLRFSPGMFFYFEPFSTVGMTVPVELAAGFAIRPDLMLNFGINMPMFVDFGSSMGMVVPVLFGGGLEYAFDQSMGLTFNLHGGPALGTGYYAAGDWYYDRWGNRYRYGRGYYGHSAVEATIGLVVKL